MQRLFTFLLFQILLANCLAQGVYNISGKVVDNAGQPLKSATVFISGSEKITMTDDNGRFKLARLSPGNFHVSISMVGYTPVTEAVTIQDSSLQLTVALKIRPIQLNLVKVGGDGSWNRHYQIFKEQFLGLTPNGRQCVIINPEILSFGTSKGSLTAEADDFLIIENKRLGYRIKFRLKYFSFNTHTLNLGYDGDASFEELNTTSKLQTDWRKNRLEAYKGSMMHFLRSVYSNTALKEGFLTYSVTSEATRCTYAAEKYTEVGIDRRPIKFDTVVNVLDDSFISLAAKHLYVVYDPEKAITALKNLRKEPRISKFTLDKGSTLKFYLNQAIIDSRGSYADYRTFFIKGGWMNLRIGDQLPFEYRPD
jgi:hypothetical protein